MLDTEQAAKKIRWHEKDNRIPREIFTDPDLYKLEMQKIFYGPVWHLIGHESEIPNPGDYKTADIGEVPVMIVRAKDGTYQTLMNSCAHRGTKIITERYGNLESGVMRCIYHMWTYDLKGDLIGVAYPDGFPEDFCKEDFGLRRVWTEVFEGCIFATLSEETPPLMEYLGQAAEGITASIKGEKLKPIGSQGLMFHCNWKLYTENAYDSYHASALHGAFRLLKIRSSSDEDYRVYAPTTCGGMYAHSWTHYRSFPIEEKDRDVLNDYSIFDIRSKEQTLNNILSIFPGPYISDQLDILQIRFVVPRGVDKTEVWFVNFARERDSEELVRHRIRQASTLLGPEGVISIEDACALQRLQESASFHGDNIVLKGLNRSPGPYRKAEEGGIREFYNAYRKIIGF